jgi:hypothetical protein
MQPQFRQRLAGVELKIVNDEVAFRGRGAGRLLSGARQSRQNHHYERPAKGAFEALEHLSPL